MCGIVARVRESVKEKWSSSIVGEFTSNKMFKIVEIGVSFEEVCVVVAVMDDQKCSERGKRKMELNRVVVVE